MKFLVVLFLISAARGTIVSYNVPVVAHTIPTAVSHQSSPVDLHSTPLVSHAWTPATYAWTPAVHSWAPTQSVWTGYHGLGHYLRKRSLLLAAPIATVAHTVVAPAVSHQSRYDITTTAGHVPLAYSVGHAPLAHAAGYISSAGHLGHSAVWSTPYGHGLGSSWGLGHLLRKRSLVTPIYGHISTPIIGQSTTISKQSLDIVHPATIHAAPIIHSPILSHAIPLAHSVWTNPIGLFGHGHLFKKRSLSPLIGHSIISTPIIGQTTSISKQSLDIVHPTTLHAHSAPILAPSAPILAHSAPILAHSAPIFAHSAPIVSSYSSPWAHYGLSHLGKW